MKNANCKLQIANCGMAGPGFFNLQFSICILQLLVALLLSLVAMDCCAIAGEPKLLDRKLLDEGWISLFDGGTLFGWQPVGEAKWEVVDGEIRTSGERPGFLMTTTEWADFWLQLEFKSPAATNSGVFLRSVLKPKDPAKDCYELNIAPHENPFPTGAFVARNKGRSHDISVLDPEKWHLLRITAKGGLFTVVVDNEEVLTHIDSAPLAMGRVGLQSNSGPVAFRNIMLRPQVMQPLFDGKTLNGWKQDRAEKCKFDVTPAGEPHLTNGPGQIETAGDFKNFVLQIDCKVNGEGLNSGVFFRTLREGRWAGYESQINNVFEGERTKPKDFGTGGIYRRQPARRVVPNDREWFTKTIVADGPHMAVWVDGYQVSDWTDTRPAKESAREGRRDGGGAVAIQGHDATTDFSFRKIRAVELPR